MRLPVDELKREHVIKALRDLDACVPHRFGVSRKFDLLHNGKTYPPKAVLGRALCHLWGVEQVENRFAGGQSTNSVLRNLGFTIVSKTGPSGVDR
jgi:5-methylcytosine-specific restriction protein A